MSQGGFHISDQDLLVFCDGEAGPRKTARVRRHLSACWTCRARMAELERAIADVAGLYHSEMEARMTPIDGPRALLRARLAERASAPEGYRWANCWHGHAAAAVLASLLLAGIVAARLGSGHLRGGLGQSDVLGKLRAVPDFKLTPGVTAPASIEDVCSSAPTANDPAVPDALKRQVLKAYGLSGASSESFEIDYLVTPQLGGAPDVRNLWPQPSIHTVWNARAKDALEDRLHELVCNRQLDLATAQREISQDWIAAYKKYFHTDAPLL